MPSLEKTSPVSDGPEESRSLGVIALIVLAAWLVLSGSVVLYVHFKFPQGAHLNYKPTPKLSSSAQAPLEPKP